MPKRPVWADWVGVREHGEHERSGANGRVQRRDRSGGTADPAAAATDTEPELQVAERGVQRQWVDDVVLTLRP